MYKGKRTRRNRPWRVLLRLVRPVQSASNWEPVVSLLYLLGLVTKEEAAAAVKATQSVNGVTHIVKVFEYIES